MIAKFMAIVEAVKLIGVAFKSFNSYVLQPFIAWNKKRKDKKIDSHYQSKIDRAERLKIEIDTERKKLNTPESDAKLEDMVRKLHNLGERYDSND